MRSEDIEYRIGANAAPFRKEMGTAAKSVKQSLSTMKSFGKVFAATVGIASIGGLAQAVRGAASDIAEMAGEAKQAGISFESWQELKFVADQNKISISAMTDGIKELQLRADEFAVTGKGPAVEAFNRLGFSADELKEKLKDPNALFEEIIKRLKEVDKAAQIRIADELFGGSGGEQFVKLLEDGTKSISEMRAEARGLGLIMSDELAVKAVDLDRKFNNIANTVSTALKSAIVEAASALSDFLTLFNQVKDRSNNALNDSLKPLNRRANLLRERIDSGTNAFGFTVSQETIDKYKSGLADVEKQISDIQNIQFQRGEKQSLDNLPPQGKKSLTAITPPATTKKSRSSSSSSNQVDELTRLIALINERKTALLAETEIQRGLNPLIDDYGFAIERARIEQELLLAAEKAGIKVTPDLAGQIKNLAGSYAQASADAAALGESQDEVRQRAAEFQEFGKSSLKGFISDLRAGKSASEALGNALNKIADKLIDMSINNLFANAFSGGGKVSGGGGGFLSSIFKSLFSADGGGYTGAGARSGGVDGKGGFPAILHPNETIIDHTRTPNLRGGNGGTQRQVIDIRLYDDTGRMAAIADQRIQTSAGDIIKVSVAQSDRMVRDNFASYNAEAVKRSL